MNLQYKAEPTASKFHRSEAFVRGLRGPIGTGKSVCCVIEMLRRSLEQRAYIEEPVFVGEKPKPGVRRSRWAAIRNTYPELKSTTIKTFEDWIPDAKISWDAPITATYRLDLPDGTIMEMEVLFLALDRPADVKKLKSLDLTGVWINECSELPKVVLDMATGRVGRYPSKKMGGFNWSGVIMDTNCPDDDHWYYELAENPSPEELQLRDRLTQQLRQIGCMRADQELYEWFSQPGALLKEGNNYVPNPAAENVKNHELGFGYWLRQVAGKTEQWIRVFLLGQYGSVHDGKPVYPEWNDSLHCKEICAIPDIPLVIGIDFGLTPAAILTQTDTRGRFLVLDELCGVDIGIRNFLEDALIPFLAREYPEWWERRDEMIVLVGDPAGKQKAQTDEKTCFAEVEDKGLKIEAAPTNAWLPRRGAVAWYLSKLSGGQPSMLVDPQCKMVRKGFNGGYKYRRIQVVGEERFTDEPHKNAFSHPHDGLQYAALRAGGIQAIRREKKSAAPKLPAYSPTSSSTGTLG